MTHEHQLLTPRQVATRLQISPLTVADYLRKGRLKGVKWGRLWRVQEEDLDRFIKTHLRSGRTTTINSAEGGDY